MMASVRWRALMRLAPDAGERQIRSHIPVTVRKRGGRPGILPPKHVETSAPPPGQDARVLRAIGRAWAWRKQMERGEITTIADLAA